jgi:hypothetical protein
MSPLSQGIRRICWGAFFTLAALLAGHIVGGLLGDALFSDVETIGRFETVGTKLGVSITVSACALFLCRYAWLSLWQAGICLLAIEGVFLAVAFLIATGGSLSEMHATEIDLIVFWVTGLTWNIVLAFPIGAVIGYAWRKWATDLRRTR